MDRRTILKSRQPRTKQWLGCRAEQPSREWLGKAGRPAALMRLALSGVLAECSRTRS